MKLEGLVKDNLKLCIQDDSIRGLVQNMDTGEKSYPDSV